MRQGEPLEMFVEADQAAHKGCGKRQMEVSAAKGLLVRISRETRPGKRRHVQSFEPLLQETQGFLIQIEEILCFSLARLHKNHNLALFSGILALGQKKLE
jgi:hypothetical protein